MELREFKDILFKKAEEVGFSKYEIYYVNKESLDIDVADLEVEKYGLSNTMGVSFRGLLNGKMGYSYTEKLDEESAEIVITNARQCAELVESDDEEFIFSGADKYEEINCYDENLANLSANEQINLAIELEKIAKSVSDKIEKVSECGVNVSKRELAIINSEGIDLKDVKTIITCGTEVVAKDGENMVNDYEFVLGTSLNHVDINKIAESAVSKTISKLGAYSVQSGKYKVLLSNDMTAYLLSAMESNFYGDVAQEGKSLLKGKIGENIATSCVNLIDNPLLPGVIGSRSFDDEGVPTRSKYLIENGEFKGFLHSLKTAKKDGVETTGNAFKAGLAAPVKVNSTNLYIEKGSKSFDELVGYIGDGLYITSLEGMHAGANAITGDFSLAAQGKLIENGKIARGVKQITVAGNFFELFQSVEEVGTDLKFGMYGTGSPSIVIKELSVAGE